MLDLVKCMRPLICLLMVNVNPCYVTFLNAHLHTNIILINNTISLEIFISFKIAIRNGISIKINVLELYLV